MNFQWHQSANVLEMMENFSVCLSYWTHWTFHNRNLTSSCLWTFTDKEPNDQQRAKGIFTLNNPSVELSRLSRAQCPKKRRISFMLFFSLQWDFLGLFGWRWPPKLRHLNIWSPVDDAIWGELGGVAFLEEVHHWGWVLRVYSPLPSSNLLFLVHVCSWRRDVTPGGGVR